MVEPGTLKTSLFESPIAIETMIPRGMIIAPARKMQIPEMIRFDPGLILMIGEVFTYIFNLILSMDRIQVNNG